MKIYLSLLCIFLSGCAVGPDYVQPDLSAQLPAHYSTQNEQQPAANQPWWQTFHDEALNQFVDRALQRNLDLMAADANIRQARAQLDVVKSMSWPQLTAQGRIGRDRISRNSEFLANIPLPNPDLNFTDYRASFDASWEIDLFGHQERLKEAAKARVASVEHQREEVALRVAAEVTRNVIQYRTTQLRIKNAEAMLADAQNLLSLTHLQQKAGLLSDSEVTQTTIAVNNAAAAIPSLQAVAAASIMAITVLVDQPQEQVTYVLQAGTAMTGVPEQIDFLGLPSDLLLRRPDLRMAERELAATTADIGVAVAEQYPRLVLMGSGGLDSVEPGKFTQLASRYWNVGPQLSVPLFSAGRLAAQVDSHEAAKDAALARYRQAVLVAFADVETALIRYQNEQQRLVQIKQAFATQEREVTFTEQRYQVGETSFGEVLQAKQRLAQINDQQLMSQQMLAENLVGLFKALGG